MVVEVPLGSRNKYEYDPEFDLMVRDRVLPGAVRYPMDYGFIPSTEAADGDPLDIALAAYDAAHPGSIVQARVVGALDLVDSTGRDPNVFAVPADDRRFDDIEELADLPDQNREEIEQFFRTYKRLEGDEDVEIRGWLDRTEALDLVRDCTR